MSFESKTQGIHLGNSSRLQFSCTIDHDRIPCFVTELNLEFATRASLREGVLNTKYSIPLLASMCTAAFEFHRRHGGSSARAPTTSLAVDGRERQIASAELAACVEHLAASIASCLAASSTTRACDRP